MSAARVSRRLIRRAAFDIGSGSTKFQCSDFNPISRRIEGMLMHEEKPLYYGADFLKSHDGRLSEGIQLEGLEYLDSLKRRAEALGVREFAGIATEVFRKAENGMEYLQRIRDEIGIPVMILTQEEEAEVGFNSVISFDENIDIVWDSGASSFQISTRIFNNNVNADGNSANSQSSTPLALYMDAIGTSVAYSMFIESVRNKDIRTHASDINPVSEKECRQLMMVLQEKLPSLPHWLQGGGHTVGVAGVNNSIFRVCCDVLRKQKSSLHNITSFNLNEAMHALQICLNHTNIELKIYESEFDDVRDSTRAMVIKLCLLVAVMQHTGIEKVITFPCVGSCPGVIINDKFWV